MLLKIEARTGVVAVLPNAGTRRWDALKRRGPAAGPTTGQQTRRAKLEAPQLHAMLAEDLVTAKGLEAKKSPGSAAVSGASAGESSSRLGMDQPAHAAHVARLATSLDRLEQLIRAADLPAALRVLAELRDALTADAPTERPSLRLVP
jgi:hypothetical protein